LEKYFSTLASALKLYFELKEPTEDQYIKYRFLKRLAMCMKHNHPLSLEELREEFLERVERVRSAEKQEGRPPSFKDFYKRYEKSLGERTIDRIEEKEIRVRIMAIRRAREMGRDKPTREDIEYASKIVYWPWWE
jgi:hypothetical protein